MLTPSAKVLHLVKLLGFCSHHGSHDIVAAVDAAGLFLLERLKPQLDIEVSQALARMAPLYHITTQRLPTENKQTAGPVLSTSTTATGGHRHKRVTRQQRAAWVRQHLTVLKQHLKQQLAKSELLVLPNGCSVAQESHVLLLQGSIQV